MLKCDDWVESYGTIDEWSAFIGVLNDVVPEFELKTNSFLIEIQKHLLIVKTVLACPEEALP